MVAAEVFSQESKAFFLRHCTMLILASIFAMLLDGLVFKHQGDFIQVLYVFQGQSIIIVLKYYYKKLSESHVFFSCIFSTYKRWACLITHFIQETSDAQGGTHEDGWCSLHWRKGYNAKVIVLFLVATFTSVSNNIYQIIS